MSTIVLGLVWPLQCSPTVKVVAVALADQANDQGMCWPALSTLAARTCLSERAVRKALRDLEEDGLLRSLRTKTSNRYVLNLAELEARKQALERAQRQAANDALAAELDELERAFSAGSECNESCYRPAPRAGETGTTCRPDRHHVPVTPAPRAGQTGTTCPLTINEPNTNTPLTPQAEPEGDTSRDQGSAEPSGKGGAAPPGAGRRRNRGQGEMLTLAAWLQRCKAAGEQAIPANDPVFAYAAAVGISEAMVGLCWREFKRRHLEGSKRYRDWRRTFGNCVRGSWYGLWYVRSGEPAQLSSKGEQTRRAFEAEDAATPALDAAALRGEAANDGSLEDAA